MGQVTTIVISNDAEELVRKHPEQVMENILSGMNMYDTHAKDFPIGNHANPMRVLRPHYTNIPKLLLAHGGILIPLGRENAIQNLSYRKQMLERAKQMLEEEENEIKRLEESGSSL